MTFQLVRATDTEIAIWQTEHGHIYVYSVDPEGEGLDPRLMRAAPDATEPPETFAEAALEFATSEAKTRGLVASDPKSVRKRRSAYAAGERTPVIGT